MAQYDRIPRNVWLASLLFPPLGWFLLWRGNYNPQSKTAVGLLGGVVVVVALLLPKNATQHQPRRQPRVGASPAVAPSLPATPPPMPLAHPHVSCAWLAPPSLGERQLLRVHETVTTHGDIFDYGMDERGIEAQVRVDCHALSLPEGGNELVDADGVALYPNRLSNTFRGYSNRVLGEQSSYAMAFEGATAVAERPALVRIEVSARVLNEFNLSRRILTREAEALARELAAYAAPRVGADFDIEAHRTHWNDLLSAMHTEDARLQWWEVERHRYYVRQGGSSSRNVRSVDPVDGEPFTVAVHLKSSWSRLPAQEQQRALNTMRQGWPDSQEVPEPNRTRSMGRDFGPYDSRPFVTNIEFVDSHGSPVFPTGE